jgi:phosphoglycolate phosphatase
MPEKREAMATHTLVLWDVDHTLIETRGVGAELSRAAFEQATGRALDHAVAPAGLTEPAIFRQNAERQSVAWSTALFDRYAALLARQYQERAAELAQRGRALPGAAGAIAALAQTGVVVQSVVTGNLRLVTQVKLKAFGLDPGLDLDVGAFGSDDPVRARLVVIAGVRAAARYGTRFDPEATVVVGDTPADVQAARQSGAKAVAVATGKSTAGELLRAGAWTVLPDLRDSGGLVRAVLGSGQGTETSQ